MHKLRTLHLFAGCGGGLLADFLLGHHPVCAVEIDTYCQQVLHQRQQDGILPWFPIFADVRQFDGKPWNGLVDVVCGGFPCTDISVAGKGAGIDGEQSGLWKEMFRVVCEVRPRYVFVENSATLTIRGLGTVLGDLAKIRFDAEWGVFSAGEIGAWHDRPRIFILAFDSMQIRTERSRQCRHIGEIGPWRKICEERLRSILEEPTTDKGSIKPLLSGTEYGLAHWMDRVGAIGNGQVPSVVKLAWQILSQ